MLEGRGITFTYNQKQTMLFENIDLQINRGEIIGMPGPSGQGKSTLAKVLAGYLQPQLGTVWLDGSVLPAKKNPVQLIFQHPEQAVNPRWTVRKIMSEGGSILPELSKNFGVQDSWLDRFPHELSGGELQRICLVRALCSNPHYLICNEITSMLDALTQASIWHSLLQEIEKRQLGALVISHDKALIARLCSRVLHFFEDNIQLLS